MATLLTPIELAQDSAVNVKAATVLTSIAGLVAAGAYLVPLKDDKFIIHVKNTLGSEATVTIAAGVGPLSGQGALAVAVAATDGEKMIGPLESSRFKDADGYVQITFSAGMTGLIGVYQLP